MEYVEINGERRTAYGWGSGDQPGEVVFAHEVSTGLARHLVGRLRELGLEVSGESSVKALGEVRTAVGRYRVGSGVGEESWFVRVSSLRGEAELERDLVNFLLARGVSVNPLLVAGAEFAFEGREYRLDVRPLLRGDHEFSEGRLVSLVEEVRGCLGALGEFPRVEEVRKISEERFIKLGAGLEELRGALGRRAWVEIAPEEDWVRENVGFLQELVESLVLDHPWRVGAQCVHGQIHRANVLFVEGDRPVLLDFEEAVHVFAPRAWDVAHVVQRFCLFDDPEPQVLKARLGVVEGSLGELGEVVRVMREVAWFSILILVMGWRDEGLRAPRSEYEKFVRFEKQARELGRILSR